MSEPVQSCSAATVDAIIEEIGVNLAIGADHRFSDAEAIVILNALRAPAQPAVDREAIRRIINGVYGVGSGTYAGGHQDKSIDRAVEAISKLYAAHSPAALVEAGPSNWRELEACPVAAPRSSAATETVIRRFCHQELADAIIAALGEPQPVSVWQPIETAPKDGSLILIGGMGSQGWFVADVKWDGAWLLWDASTDEYSEPCFACSHWMPIPAPPLPRPEPPSTDR